MHRKARLCRSFIARILSTTFCSIARWLFRTFHRADGGVCQEKHKRTPSVLSASQRMSNALLLGGRTSPVLSVEMVRFGTDVGTEPQRYCLVPVTVGLFGAVCQV